jgi:cation diffusion facilitator CzcD-associated flavoprotein CzcO
VTETTGVVVVGAGPAGLAVAACLRKAGLDFTILEKENQVGSSWRRHCRICLCQKTIRATRRVIS